MPAGRPSLLTDDFIRRVVAHVRLGNYAETAALAEGASRASYYSWCSQGAADLAADVDSPAARFLDSITRARASAECDFVARLSTEETESAVQRALQWLLERTRRERFGQQIQIVQREQVQDDLLARLRARLDQDDFSRVVEALVGEDGDEVPDDERAAH